MDFTQLLKFRRLVSSAKWCTSEYLIATCKSLVQIRSKRGPSKTNKKNEVVEEVKTYLNSEILRKP